MVDVDENIGAAMPVRIVDVTNRDGIQAAGVHLSPFARVMVVAMLARGVVAEAEIGFPCLDHEGAYLRAVTALKRNGALGNMVLTGWCRATEDDIVTAVANCPDLDGLNLSVPVSDLLIRAKFQGNRHWVDIRRNAVAAVRRARSLGLRTVTVNMEDASRASLSRVEECGRLALEAGVDRVRYCDTVGVENPIRLYRRIGRLAARGIGPLAIHCHNDTGMAVACSLSAAQAALEQGSSPFVDVTVNGIGERAGNTSLLTFLLALCSGSVVNGEPDGVSSRGADALARNLPYRDILEQVRRAGRYLAMETGASLPFREPGIGEQVFLHSSGIHVDGMLKDPASYEAVPRPESGMPGGHAFPDRRFVLGPYSGTHALQYVYGQLGSELDRQEARALLPLVQRVIIQMKRPATPEELLFIRRHRGIVEDLVTPRGASRRSNLHPASPAGVA